MVYRGKLDAPGKESVAEHDLVSEVYHIVDGSGTLVLGPDLVGKKRRPATAETVRLFNGPGNNSEAIRNGVTYQLNGTDHVAGRTGTSSPRSRHHISYIMVRIDPDKVTGDGRSGVKSGWRPRSSRFLDRSRMGRARETHHRPSRAMMGSQRALQDRSVFTRSITGGHHAWSNFDRRNGRSGRAEHDDRRRTGARRIQVPQLFKPVDQDRRRPMGPQQTAEPRTAGAADAGVSGDFRSEPRGSSRGRARQ
jgi:hypothetical protein